jgi:hypothetical protein
MLPVQVQQSCVCVCVFAVAKESEGWDPRKPLVAMEVCSYKSLKRESLLAYPFDKTTTSASIGLIRTATKTISDDACWARREIGMKHENSCQRVQNLGQPVRQRDRRTCMHATSAAGVNCEYLDTARAISLYYYRRRLTACSFGLSATKQ